MQPVMQAPPRLPHPPPEPLTPPLLPPRLPPLAPQMSALDKKLREELENKSGDWSLYLYRLDTDEEIAINADQPMVSASLIKLYIAGCYLERVKKGKLDDNYDYQLFKMLSESDNGATNTLIDVLGMDRINRFMKKHHFKAGKLNRKMLVQNGTENYTSPRSPETARRSPQASPQISRPPTRPENSTHMTRTAPA